MDAKKIEIANKKRRATFERKRRKGFERYIKKKRREKAAQEKKKAKEKERLKAKKEKERLKAKMKRPVGRPKKRGPKKKRRKKIVKSLKSPGRHKLPPFDYKIISCRNGNQNKFIGKYRSVEDAYEVFNDLKTADKNVIFPSILSGDDKIKNAIDEYILIKKDESKTNLLRNEYGKLVEHIVDKDGWIIIDKFRYNKEETFWVYGYDNKKDRKTFLWIYTNLVVTDIDGYFDFKRVLIYKNKLIVKDDFNNMEIVICKDVADAVRVYNKIEEWIKRDKIKKILFLGDFSELGEKRRNIEKEIAEVTGWNKKKVQMKTTTFYYK